MTLMSRIFQAGIHRTLRLCGAVFLWATRIWPSIIVNVWFTDFWSMRERLIRSSGFANNFLESLYYSYLKEKQFFIGSRSVLKSQPVFPHGMVGIFISEGARLGSGCTIFPHTVIGSNSLHGSSGKGAPTIGDNCYLGAGATIIGGICIGNNCRIGANTTVSQNIPDNCVVVAQKPRIIRKQLPDNVWEPH